MDDEETAGVAFGQLSSQFIRTKVVPEMDAYTLQKLAAVAVDNTNTATLDTTKAYKQFVTLVNGVQAKAGFDTELVAFVNPDVYAAFMNSTEVQRFITVSDFKQGEINLRVKKLNDVVIIPVADDRMKTDYEDDAANGGLKPTANAKNIGMLILPKKAASLVKKSEKNGLYAALDVGCVWLERALAGK